MDNGLVIDAIRELGYQCIVYETINSEEDWNNNIKIISGEDENNVAIFYENNPITFAQITEKYNEIENNKKWEVIREKRNQLLAETDFYALSDVTMTTEMSNYRQALRDLPSSTSNPDDVVFPTKP